ncbi:hypothetical protein [Microbacterium trichothecenolyticum]|uniref:Uncharacterized protein n=1 Tax=Microbacterium trichothecenolyticum TaxID=69370 RepID=A0A0M2HK77_MICTR|nr:hypothetical protein [Microbacterium trichothecenolyticum]KJL45262.1 hypothetical protein RS82_00289 [Microbacterium trichothecenolyticum]
MGGQAGRIIGLIAASAGLAVAAFAPVLGIALGLLGFVLSNTAWAHLRNAGRRRTLPIAAQFIAGAAAIAGIAALIIGAVLGL